MVPGSSLELSRKPAAESWTMQIYGIRKAAKAAKKASREEKRKLKMQQRNESIHKMVFERLDKEMRRTEPGLVKTVPVLSADNLTKDIYPYTSHVAKIIRKFDLPDKFFYAHVDDENNWTAHFTVNREEDPVTHIERATSISVIVVR